jgi:hypothetical protein
MYPIARPPNMGHAFHAARRSRVPSDVFEYIEITGKEEKRRGKGSKGGIYSQASLAGSKRAR